MKLKSFFIFILLLFTQTLIGGERLGDTLSTVYDDVSNPEEAFEELLELIRFYDGKDSKKMLSVANYMIDFVDRFQLEKRKGQAYRWLGWSFVENNELDQGVETFFKAIDLNEKTENKDQLLQDYYALGFVYLAHLRDFEKAEKYYLKSKTLAEETKNLEKLGAILLNLGATYSRVDKYEKFLEYTKSAMEIYEQLEDFEAILETSINMGAYHYYNYEESKLQKDYNEAKKYFDRAYKIGLENEDLSFHLPAVYIALGALEVEANNLSAAESHLLNAEQILLVDNKFSSRLKDVYSFLAALYEKAGQYEKCSYYLNELLEIKDSLFYNAREEIVAEMEAKYDNKQKEKQLEIQNLELSEKELKLKQSETFKYALIVGLILLGGLSFVVYLRFREKKKANQILNDKNQLIEEKNKEITDSINYAKRIQNAILPPLKLVKEYIPDSFILYKPKDVVAGDFYWMHCQPAGREQVKDEILFAAADCTGHGVPGAMVSVVCNNGLNRSVREYGLTDPGEILDKTRDVVISEFEKSEEEVKDGMDISLCALDFKNKTLAWAGANNPLWIIRNGEILETKSNKQPIGVVDNPQPFTTHKIELQKGDIIYVFTDGFQDQFGGERLPDGRQGGKKFKPANFKKLLLSISSEPMNKQLEIIDKTFEDWKGELEQLDDVCVIGVRL